MTASNTDERLPFPTEAESVLGEVCEQLRAIEAEANDLTMGGDCVASPEHAGHVMRALAEAARTRLHKLERYAREEQLRRIE